MASTRSLRVRKRKEMPDFEYSMDEILKHQPKVENPALDPKASKTVKNEEDSELPVISFSQSVTTDEEVFCQLSSKSLIKIKELLGISEDVLIRLFTEKKDFPSTRMFTYKCCMMPESSSCSRTYKSYGNDKKARTLMEEHLSGHVRNLHKRKKWFTTTPLQMRNKISYDEVDIENDPLEEEPVQASEPPKRGTKLKTAAEMLRLKLKVAPPKKGSNGRIVKQDPPAKEKISSFHCRLDNSEPSGVTKERLETHMSLIAETHDLIRQNKEVLEKINADQKLERQPYKDHSYDIRGKTFARFPGLGKMKNGIETDEIKNFVYTLDNKSVWYTHADESSDDDEEVKYDLAQPNPVVGRTAQSKPTYMLSSGERPLVALIKMDNNSVVHAPQVGEELVIQTVKPKPKPHTHGCVIESDSEEEEIKEEPDKKPQTNRPYPPMPKYMPDLGTKLVVPEEEMNYEEAGSDIGDDELDMHKPEHVRRFAVRCMRSLKSDKGVTTKSRATCKICQKEFTAAATLMYHYRSHADIKPFVCLLCNATFTRQHSLNYHMLIHNNATRFKCPVCGRAFRHPSHFKEHQRRHTGETPYKCSICAMRFKTRNSYKRHMTAKHKGAPLEKPKYQNRDNEFGLHTGSDMKSVIEATLQLAQSSNLTSDRIFKNEASEEPASESSKTGTQDKPGSVQDAVVVKVGRDLSAAAEPSTESRLTEESVLINGKMSSTVISDTSKDRSENGANIPPELDELLQNSDSEQSISADKSENNVTIAHEPPTKKTRTEEEPSATAIIPIQPSDKVPRPKRFKSADKRVIKEDKSKAVYSSDKIKPSFVKLVPISID